jgi:formylglycine-generating enzyme required for sulfatase activity/tRNA A-37 threonylcarbamoyl transferase component Bud32
MSYCLNPDCQKPQNPPDTKFCQNCGQAIALLRGRFRIVRPLGQGGFGKTYLAEDVDRRNASCVVKQFAPAPELRNNPQILEKATELFNQEAERLLQLEEHPQIPTLLAYFEENSCLYLVQQFIKGQTLKEELEQEGTFSESKIRELLADLLPVLQFIHDHNVIHRDLKLENIIRRQTDGKLVLIDFGVARKGTSTVATQAGTTVGTPGYAPLEQLRGKTYPASDLYSLAVTCVVLLTGWLPEDDGSNPLYDDLEGRWLWRSQVPPGNDISWQLEQILDKLLANLVKERYQSAEEVLAALNSQVVPLARNSPLTMAQPVPQQQIGAQPAITPLRATAPIFIIEHFDFEVVTLKIGYKSVGSGTKGFVKKFTRAAEAEFFSEELDEEVNLEMVSLPRGTFMMGSPPSEVGRTKFEIPQHQVNISPLFLSKYPITQAQWQAVMGNNPSRFKSKKRPIESISWYKAQEFCQKLSQKTGRNYRLPSEAEWEYAARAETTTPFSLGEVITTEFANYNGTQSSTLSPPGIYRQETTDVGSFPANAFGLHDMHGNVWEWCGDTWHDNYNNAPSDGSTWLYGGNPAFRPLRGGSWNDEATYCRSAHRLKLDLGTKLGIIGFRVALS